VSNGPSKTIDDPRDKKPTDWVNEEEMNDPNDVQPSSNWDDEPGLKIENPVIHRMVEHMEIQSNMLLFLMVGDEVNRWKLLFIDIFGHKGEWFGLSPQKPKKIPIPDCKEEWKFPNPEYKPDPNLHEFLHDVF